MQRPTENLHRATPVPILDHMPRKRSNPMLSVGSIPEDEEEVDDVSSSYDKGSSKGWSSRLGKTSPNQAGKGIEGNGEFTGKESLSLKAGLRRPFSISNQSSPTGSLDSQGSGITNRSHDSLHRPTPIPSDASHSLSMAPSIGKRSGGRLQPSTPTINEFEDMHEDLLDTDQDYLVRNESLGNRSNSSLHRATPVPTDLSSSSSSAGKLMGHRLSTPTIQENEVDRDAEQDSHTEQDSNDFYYGMSQRRAQPVRYERDSPVGDSSQQSSGSTRNTFQFDRDAADALPAVKAPVKPLHAQEAETTVQRGVPGEGVAKASPPSAAKSQGQAGSPFSPIVDSKEWERDILGVARFLRMCPGLSRQLIGDILGENNERCLRVLECFTASFDFTGLSFEAALREYLESFRLPGESQKIYRILESWSRQFFRQCPGFFRTSDAVLILAFSLILLNTDKHNRTVKQKMTCNQFLKNTRGTNDGQDFPQEFLEDLFRSIERRAIRMPPAHHSDNVLQRNSLPEPLR